MLVAFRDLVVAFDCDVFTGYNICNFDFLYLRDRAVALQCDAEFEHMTKLAHQRHRMYLRETVFQSVQMGKRKRVRVSIPGRVCLDMLTCIQNNQSYKLEKYTLNAVSEHFLGDKKVDLPFTQITPLWERDEAGRQELGVYCLKDAQLPLDLMEKLDSLTQTVEMARCTGIPFDWVLQRGIMVRNTSLLLRRALVRNYLFPLLPQQPEDAARNRFEGATVLDAACGIHHNVGVLDFSSMYPSIIRAHNLCYSTILLPSSVVNGNEEVEAINGQRFVTDAVVKGLLPEVSLLL
jgi:DNA polymerase delta subunit 1